MDSGTQSNHYFWFLSLTAYYEFIVFPVPIIGSKKCRMTYYVWRFIIAVFKKISKLNDFGLLKK